MQTAGLYAVEPERLDFTQPPPTISLEEAHALRRQDKATREAESRLALWHRIRAGLPDDTASRDIVAAMLASRGQ